MNIHKIYSFKDDPVLWLEGVKYSVFQEELDGCLFTKFKVHSPTVTTSNHTTRFICQLYIIVTRVERTIIYRDAIVFFNNRDRGFTTQSLDCQLFVATVKIDYPTTSAFNIVTHK